MNGFPRGESAIVGAATFGIGEAHGFSSMDLAAKASSLALQQAGLTPDDVDALFICTPDDMLSGLTFAEYLGIHPLLTDNNRTGGSAFQSHVFWAALALATGQCNVALIAYGSNQRSASGKLMTPAGSAYFEGPYKPIMPASSYALAAQRHMHMFGTTREQLAQVAVVARQWANLNPEAFMRGPLSVDDVLNARMVSSPLSVRDCCLVTDGAAAVVMVRKDRAKDHSDRPAYVLGAAMETTHRHIAMMPDLTVTGVKAAGERAYAQAKIKPSDVDVVQLYDAFTINTILFLEDLGFCAKGEGGAFVQSGAIAPGGQLPVNTNGGGLSCVHPGMYGLFTIVESATQIARKAGQRQQATVDVAIANGNGGVLSSEGVVILGSGATL